MTSHSESEFLTVDQFAQRLQVSRTTVFGWLKNGDLREGVHYIRLGRILRFRWPFFLTAQPSPPASLPPPEKRHRRRRGTSPAIMNFLT